MSRNQRRIRGFLISNGPQLEISLLITVLGLAALGGIVAFFLIQVRGLMLELVAHYAIDPSAIATLNAVTVWAGTITVISALVFAFANWAALIMLTHRLIGPSVPLKALIKELARGNYKARGRLRKNDDYQDVMAALNELAAELEKKTTG